MTFTDLLLEATRPLKQTMIPRATCEPAIKIWSVSSLLGYHENLKEVVYGLLPSYWGAEGIVDCKILHAPHKASFLIIESWSSKEYQSAFENGNAWRQFTEEVSDPNSICKARISDLVNDIFELIE